jgi:hypothetical protein
VNNNNNNNNNNNKVDLIDIAVPLSHNIQNVYAQKINKYAELATEIQQLWNMQINKYQTNGYFGHWDSTPTS